MRVNESYVREGMLKMRDMKQRKKKQVLDCDCNYSEKIGSSLSYISTKTKLKFTKVVPSVLLDVHRGLCRISNPCNIVALFPFLAVSNPYLRFGFLSCNFHHCIFHRTVVSCLAFSVDLCEREFSGSVGGELLGRLW